MEDLALRCSKSLLGCACDRWGTHRFKYWSCDSVYVDGDRIAAAVDYGCAARHNRSAIDRRIACQTYRAVLAFQRENGKQRVLGGLNIYARILQIIELLLKLRPLCERFLDGILE